MINKWYNHNREVIVTVTYLSLLFNILLLLTISLIVYKKTDLYNKTLSKIGLIDYDVNESRRLVEWRTLEGWANTIEQMNINTDVVFYGNSITYESNFQEFFPNMKICNLGCNRDDLDDLLFRSFMIRSVHPHKIFLLGGINRLMDISLDDFKNKYAVLVDTIIKQNPSTELFLQSLLPINADMEIGSRYKDGVDKIKKANEIIKGISQSKRCTFIDLYSAYQVKDSLPSDYTRDGLHLKPDAYAIWADVVRPYIEK